jgi:hypothetical protein
VVDEYTFAAAAALATPPPVYLMIAKRRKYFKYCGLGDRSI